MTSQDPATVQVLLFAAARERVGQGRLSWALPTPPTVAALLDALAAAHPALAPLRPYLRVAVDEAFVEPEAALAPGAVVALIPPVSGGDGRLGLSEAALDPAAVEAAVAHPSCGGRVSFVGTVRDHHQGHGVESLTYEAYEPMALRVFAGLAAEAEGRWPGVRVAVWHRLGTLSVGEVAVVVAVAAPHRAEAFEACRFVIEGLKADAPIFKRERRTDGEVWVGLGP